MTPSRVVLDLDAEVLVVLLVPGVWQLVNLELAGEDVALHLEADYDVEPVGDLVCLDPDLARLDDVDGGDEVGELDASEWLTRRSS